MAPVSVRDSSDQVAVDENGNRRWTNIYWAHTFIADHADQLDKELVGAFFNNPEAESGRAGESRRKFATQLSKYRPELLKEFLDKLHSYDWLGIIENNPSFVDEEILQKHIKKILGNKNGIAQSNYELLVKTRPQIFTKSIVSETLGYDWGLSGRVLINLAWQRPDLFDKELFDKTIGWLSWPNSQPEAKRAFLESMAKSRPGLLTDELIDDTLKRDKYSLVGSLGELALSRQDIIEKFGKHFQAEDWNKIASGKPDLLTENVVDSYIVNLPKSSSLLNTWQAVFAQNPQNIIKYKDAMGDWFPTAVASVASKLTPEILIAVADKLNQYALEKIVFRNPDIFTEEAVKATAKHLNRTAIKTLYSFKKIDKETYLALSSRGQDYRVSVSEDDYVLFKKMERYMSENGIDKLTSKELAELGIKENPIIREFLKKNNGRPISLADVKEMERLSPKQEFYQHWGEYSESEVQSHEDVAEIPKLTFSLGLKNVDGLSDNAKRFLENEMKTHKIGFGDSDEFGFILYKHLDDLDALPPKSVLIEEIQSDMARFIPNLFAALKSENQSTIEYAQKEIERLKQAYGGENGLKEISREMNKLTKNYVRILLNAFLKKFSGWNVYIPNSATIVDVAGLNEVVAKKIYDEVPRQYGFKENKELPWALKLKNAGYRQQIKTAAISLL